MTDLKRDARFKVRDGVEESRRNYQARMADAHLSDGKLHLFPRRVLYELRSARDWYRERNAVFSAISEGREVRQKKRIVESVGDYYAFFAPSRARSRSRPGSFPHSQSLFESLQGETAPPGDFVARTLRRLEQVTPNLPYGVHTAPKHAAHQGEWSDYWRTIAGELPLAYRNPSHPKVAEQVVYDQRGLFQWDDAGRGSSAAAPDGSGEGSMTGGWSRRGTPAGQRAESSPCFPGTHVPHYSFGLFVLCLASFVAACRRLLGCR